MTREQGELCDIVSRHFGIKLATTREAVKAYLEDLGREDPVVEMRIPERGLDLRVGSSKNTAKLGQMLMFKTFSTTALYTDVVNMIENEMADFVVFFADKKVLMVVRQANSYEGIGGILVSDGSKGYAIEPAKHYFKTEYPIYLEE